MAMDSALAPAPFPESKRVIYQKNPLVEVICQLRFPPILEISSKDPADFQNEIRQAYPLYDKEEAGGLPKEVAGGLPKEVADLLERLSAPRLSEEITHKFANEDSKRVISLTRDFVAVSDRSYQRWETFRLEVERAKAALEEWYRPGFYSRIGLRYRDIISRRELGLQDVPWEELIHPSVIGLQAESDIRERVRNIRGYALIDLSDQVAGGLAHIRHGLVEAGESGEAGYMIDADFFTEERSTHHGVFDTLDKFNRLAGNFFRWAITPRLHEALEPEYID